MNMDQLKDFSFTTSTVVVLGCSYGPDSMALFHLLLEKRKEVPFKLVIAHVNHNKRRASQKEKEELESICERVGVPFEYMKIENYGEDNFHNEARKIRYRFFEDICQKYGANYLMTAHHADDLMETILMRIVRGATLSGYAGFSKKVDYPNYQLVRPLYEVTKTEILDYCKKNHVPYAIDQSNFKSVYTRNRYRKKILPFLKKEDKNVHIHFIQFHKKLMEASKFIEQETNRIYEKIVDQNTLSFKISSFTSLDDFLKKEILAKMLSHFYQDDLVLITEKHIYLLLDLMKRKASSVIIQLPNEVEAVKSYDTFYLRKMVDTINSYEIEVSSYVKLPNGHILESLQECDETSNCVTRLSSNDLELPLFVRTRKIGDRIALKGQTGHRKVKDILIDKKISLDERDLWPIVVDSKGEIVFIPGLKKSKFDKKKTESYDIILKYQ